MKVLSFSIRNASLFILIVGMLGFLFLFCDNDSSTVGPDFSASEDFYYQIAIKNLSGLQLNAINGTVDIEGVSSIDSVTVWGERRVESNSRADADAHLPDLSVEMSESEDRISIRTEQPDQSSGRNYIVDYNIRIPGGWQLDIGQVNGNVSISSMENSVISNLVNGNMRLWDISGSVNGGLVNGGIDSKISLPASGICGLSVVNGTIDLLIPQSTSADFSAHISSGSINLSNVSLQNQTITPTSVTGLFGAGAGEIELSVVNGFITVTGF
ncbi:MAG: hypothetical protein JSV84_08295 [Gemmatimonadota bacterium]|nr:MAG: hypothetical protein JSV84_08295 [Gemmatimonadota bacterium]